MKRRFALRGEAGFTLLELIVVMAILAVLAAVVVPKFADILEDAKKKAHAANIEMLRNAWELYDANEGAKIGDTLDVLVEDYIREIPKNPVTGDLYTLEDLDAGGNSGETGNGNRG